MAKKIKKNPNMGGIKRSTDKIIEEAVARQTSWMERRRAFAKRFLKSLNLFARPAVKKIVGRPAKTAAAGTVSRRDKKKSGPAAYWFPILCALLVVFIAVWVAFFRVNATEKIVVIPAVPEPTIQVVAENAEPSFDIVRIEKDGNVVIAGRWLPSANVSIVINKKVVATERTDARGEFVYAPTRAFAPGNYTISLVGADTGVKSESDVFVYISPRGYENSISLLMTKNGSTLLQSPKLVEGDLQVSKIDYLDSGRIVVTGDALPRLRVSLSLDGTYLGFARVSDHKHFGLGADVGELKPGREYKLEIRLHDGDGRTVATVRHEFAMPEPTGDSDTFYTVRRGDCLWIIARNFLRRGILFSIIAERNNIENPDLIFPKQILNIPISK
ncbi:MAG: LysM peptidoglycan-binding domain-containing protein [Rickettsiales bacterium]|jgi:nucleoid-associated protein YgaU|nr:LysM peptidoglycan-binding domain-containing protein [Rickettsiales bacterium]